MLSHNAVYDIKLLDEFDKKLSQIQKDLQDKFFVLWKTTKLNFLSCLNQQISAIRNNIIKLDAINSEDAIFEKCLSENSNTIEKLISYFITFPDDSYLIELKNTLRELIIKLNCINIDHLSFSREINNPLIKNLIQEKNKLVLEKAEYEQIFKPTLKKTKEFFQAILIEAEACQLFLDTKKTNLSNTVEENFTKQRNLSNKINDLRYSKERDEYDAWTLGPKHELYILDEEFERLHKEIPKLNRELSSWRNEVNAIIYFIQIIKSICKYPIWDLQYDKKCFDEIKAFFNLASFKGEGKAKLLLAKTFVAFHENNHKPENLYSILKNIFENKYVHNLFYNAWMKMDKGIYNDVEKVYAQDVVASILEKQNLPHDLTNYIALNFFNRKEIAKAAVVVPKSEAHTLRNQAYQKR